MPRFRKIAKRPDNCRNYYLVDACFLANKHIPTGCAPNDRERERLERCREWWHEIDDQLSHRCARVYIPDICIAEAFKVLAKKYYVDDWFKKPADLARARRALSRDVRTDTRNLKRHTREVGYHDISTNRDIIVGVDRFFELFHTRRLKVSVPDLIVLATAKYLLEFFDLPKERLYIVTMDNDLREGCSRASDLPNAFDPTLRSHRAGAVFV